MSCFTCVVGSSGWYVFGLTGGTAACCIAACLYSRGALLLNIWGTPCSGVVNIQLSLYAT
jgi:hypothetical protein